MNYNRDSLGTRGFTTTIFKWLFGVVAGALLFIFLARFALQHVAVSTALTEREALEYLDDQLDAFRVAESSSKILDVPESLTLTATCDGLHAGTAARQSTTLVFAQSSLQGKIRAWTESWDFPYPITNVFYLADASTRFLFIYNDASRAFVQGLQFPSIFSVQMMHVRDFRAERVQQESGTKDVHLVFFTEVPHAQLILRALPRAHVLEVQPEASQVLSHNTGTRTLYLGEEMLYGALFSPELFPCLQERARERLRLVTEVYLGKTALLQLKASDTCTLGLASLQDALREFARAPSAVELRALLPSLERSHQTLRRNDCAHVY